MTPNKKLKSKAYMGFDIIAVSKAERIRCSGGDECDDTHWPVGRSIKHRNGLKSGCYITGSGGKDIGFCLSYTAYGDWANELSMLALGVPRDEVLRHRRRYRGKPFVELIDFPDADNAAIGPKTAGKLHADFVTFAAKAKKHFVRRRAALGTLDRKRHRNDSTDTDIDWMWDVYRDFRSAFKLARNDGFVTFC
jgi:hypothetical protein